MAKGSYGRNAGMVTSTLPNRRGVEGMIKQPICVDSHISEPSHCYVAYIDPKFRARAPRMERLGWIGDTFIIGGLIGFADSDGAGRGRGQVSVADYDARRGLQGFGRGVSDSQLRGADQERDGVAAEFIYATVGMMLCIIRTSILRKPSSAPIIDGCRRTVARRRTGGTARSKFPCPCSRPRTSSPKSFTRRMWASRA